MTIKDQVQRASLDQTLRNMPRRTLCKIIQFLPDTPGGPSVICVPYSRLEDSQSSYPPTPEGRARFMGQYGRQLWVNYPRGQRYRLDRDMHDVYADAPFWNSRECYPVLKPGARQEDFRVPDGDTALETEFREVSPSNVGLRIRNAREKIKSRENCSPDEPRYPRQGEIWHGPVKHHLDQLRAELWGGPRKLLAKLDRNVADIMAEIPRFPLADGVNLVWRDKREHPFQRHIGSSAAMPYRRFIWSLVDPGYIVNVYREIRRFLDGLDSDFPGRKITKYESIDLGVEIRED